MAHGFGLKVALHSCGSIHRVIPELIERLEVRKGPYYAEYGDFSTAGTINVVTTTGETWDETSESFVRVLREVGGNRQEAARILGIDRSTLYRKMQRFATGDANRTN